MSKSSTVTARETPVLDRASAAAGGLTVHGETLVFQTNQRIELVDLTDRVMAYVQKLKIREGLVSLWSMHNDPDHSDCDRMNADSHLRAMLLGHSLTLQISGGELVLGQWQRILAAELDGPRARTLRIQAFGVA